MLEYRVRFPIGLSDFRMVREGGFWYIDKSALIEDVLDAGAQVLLVPRPRRFGKTSNLSMLRYFLAKSPEDRSALFAGLAVASSEIARPHAQRYPVIFMVALRSMARAWLEAQVGGSDRLAALLDALLRGDAPVVERHLTYMVLHNLSYFDTAAPAPERFYHGFVVGLLAGLGSRYEVRSNRESGLGRCDVMVIPRIKGEPGVVLELKRVDTEAGETVEKAFRAALRQIRDRDYAAELRERGAAPIHELAAVFDGKRAHVRAAGEPKKVALKPRAKAKARVKSSRR